MAIWLAIKSAFAAIWGFPAASLIPSVSVAPGSTLLTVIPRGPISCASIMDYEGTHGKCTETFVKKVRRQLRAPS